MTDNYYNCKHWPGGSYSHSPVSSKWLILSLWISNKNLNDFRYSYFMELVTDPATKNTICQETWNMLYRQIYGGFTNITQVSHSLSGTLLRFLLLPSLYSHLPPSSLVTAALLLSLGKGHFLENQDQGRYLILYIVYYRNLLAFLTEIQNVICLMYLI